MNGTHSTMLKPESRVARAIASRIVRDHSMAAHDWRMLDRGQGLTYQMDFFQARSPTPRRALMQEIAGSSDEVVPTLPIGPWVFRWTQGAYFRRTIVAHQVPEIAELTVVLGSGGARPPSSLRTCLLSSIDPMLAVRLPYWETIVQFGISLPIEHVTPEGRRHSCTAVLGLCVANNLQGEVPSDFWNALAKSLPPPGS